MFEVFMDINEAAFQKSSTCLAEARQLGQEENACWSGKVFMKICAALPRIVWSTFEHPRDVITPTIPPQTQSVAMENRCFFFLKGLNVLYQYEGAMDKIQVQIILIYKCYTLCKANSPVETPAKLFRIIFTVSGINLPI